MFIWSALSDGGTLHEHLDRKAHHVRKHLDIDQPGAARRELIAVATGTPTLAEEARGRVRRLPRVRDEALGQHSEPVGGPLPAVPICLVCKHKFRWARWSGEQMWTDRHRTRHEARRRTSEAKSTPRRSNSTRGFMTATERCCTSDAGSAPASASGLPCEVG